MYRNRVSPAERSPYCEPITFPEWRWGSHCGVGMLLLLLDWPIQSVIEWVFIGFFFFFLNPCWMWERTLFQPKVQASALSYVKWRNWEWVNGRQGHDHSDPGDNCTIPLKSTVSAVGSSYSFKSTVSFRSAELHIECDSTKLSQLIYTRPSVGHKAPFE